MYMLMRSHGVRSCHVFMVTYCGCLGLGSDLVAIAAKSRTAYWASHSALHKNPFRLPRWWVVARRRPSCVRTISRL
jgi:hypothetical protein